MQRIYTYGSTHADELDLLLAALDTADKGSLYDVLFCLRCILVPYILRYVCVRVLVLCVYWFIIIPDASHYAY